MEINELFRKLDKGGYSSTLMQLKKAFFNKIGEEFFYIIMVKNIEKNITVCRGKGFRRGYFVTFLTQSYTMT